MSTPEDAPEPTSPPFLPVVSSETLDAVVPHTESNIFFDANAKRMFAEQPELIETFSRMAKTMPADEARRFLQGAVTVYAVLRSQGEADIMKRHFGMGDNDTDA